MPSVYSWMWPNLVMTEDEKKIKWEGKRAVITWMDGTKTFFPILSLSHYCAIKRMIDSV